MVALETTEGVLPLNGNDSTLTPIINQMNYNLNIPGWTNEKELFILSTLASFVPNNGSIVEVGCLLGRSTTALYMGKKQSVTLDVIDNFSAPTKRPYTPSKKIEIHGNSDIYLKAMSIAQRTSWQDAFKFCIGEEMYNNISVHCMDSRDYIKKHECDLAFIDGSHTYLDVMSDMKKHMTTSNLILGDDFYIPEVSQAVSLFSKKRTMVIFADTKLYALIPSIGYWKNIFKENNLLFL